MRTRIVSEWLRRICSCHASFLDEIHELLEAHRQVIFFGPPGTGKTYVAQRLAEALAPIDEHRMLIQFHPSTSYEDFFEGYRPLSDRRRPDGVQARLRPACGSWPNEHRPTWPGVRTS